MDQPVTAVQPAGEVSFRSLLAEAWHARWIILLILAVTTVAGGVAGSINEKKYRAEILLSPVSESPTASVGGLGGIASQYGELASLAGLSLSSKGASNKDESLAVLQSELITEAYVREHDLLPLLFPKHWDAVNKRWKATVPESTPTPWMANQAFKKIRDVKPDKQSGLVTLRITWRDPAIAAEWANGLVQDTNRYLREKAIRESESNIAYLNQEATKTNIIEAKAAIFSLLRSEVNKQMIAKGREEYALKVLDPARTPESPSSPPALLVAIAGFIAGSLLSAIFVLRKSGLFRE